MNSIWDRIQHRRRRYIAKLIACAMVWSERIGLSRIKPAGNGVVVSLTTYPARLASVYITIETILNQSVKPDRLVLWLSETEIKPEHLPKQLVRQQRRGLEVRFVQENLRSYKKLFYMARESVGQTVVTIDDDILYPRYWLEKMLVAKARSPNAILCYRGAYIDYDARGNRLPYLLWSHYKGADRESLRLFPIGVSGILYPPNSIDLALLDSDLFMSLCPTGDDIWFRAMTLYHGWKCRRVFKESIHFPIIPGTQETSLHKVNNLENRNQFQIESVFKHFGLDERLRNEITAEPA